MQVNLNDLEFEIIMVSLERFKTTDRLKKRLAEMAIKTLEKAYADANPELPFDDSKNDEAGTPSDGDEPTAATQRGKAGKSVS